MQRNGRTIDTPFERLAVFLRAREGRPDLQLEDWLGQQRSLSEAEAQELRRAWADWRRGSAGLAALRPSSPRTPGVGIQVEGFTLIRPLGRGGQATVWEAEQAPLGRRVALKLLLSDHWTPHSRARFLREAQAGARLEHESIVTVYAFGELDDGAWLAEELIPEGRTLRERLEEVRPAVRPPDGWFREVARTVRAVAEGLHAAHEAGIVHRDVKPQNVLLGPDGRPKISDFGLARLEDIDAFSQSGQLVGTHLYMSPEQVLARRSDVDRRSDVFSLGIVLYELLTLSRPFDGDTTHQIFERILHHEPTAPAVLRSGVPRDLSVICMKALEKNASRRYATMEALAADLGRHLAQRPILARPPSTSERALKWVRRHPAWSLAGAVAAVAFAAITGLFVSHLRMNRDLTSALGERAVAIQELDSANRELIEQRERARASADQERVRADQVLRLSALQEVDLLQGALPELWPPHPDRVEALRDWVDQARRLVAALPDHELQLARLHERATELHSGELAALLDEPATLVSERRRLASLELAADVKAGRRTFAPMAWTDVSVEFEPEDDLGRLASEAWGLVHWRRFEHGRESEGMAMAQHLLDSTDDWRLRCAARETLAWGLLHTGQDEAAVAEAYALMSTAPAAAGRYYEGFYHRIEVEAARAAEERDEWIREARASVGRLERRLDRQRERTFERPEDLWWADQLSKLIDELEALRLVLEFPQTDTVQEGWSVPRRLAFAERVQSELASTGTWEVRWQAARRAIRDQNAYDGLDLRAQFGLVPIGPDPDSGLWEFWCPASGSEPSRDDEGRLQLKEADGLVLVLLPGGTFRMGAQSVDPSRPNWCAHAFKDEGPVQWVEVEPFFLSKFELTQGQWKRLAGWNRSTHGPEGKWRNQWLRTGDYESWLLPVTDVSWTESMLLMRRFGWTLPSEAEWEYACRAEADGAWGSGDDPADLSGLANLRDRFGASFSHVTTPHEAWLDDGAVVAAPVGTYRANSFGLHDMHGNVSEWCGSIYREELVAGEESGDVLRSPGLRTLRGGNWAESADQARSAQRDPHSTDFQGQHYGLRPARRLDP